MPRLPEEGASAESARSLAPRYRNARPLAPGPRGRGRPSELQQIGGVPTYVVTPDGAPTGDDSPVFLSIHGGGLIMGGGDLTRVMTEISALSAK